MNPIKSLIYETQYQRRNFENFPDYLKLYLGGLKSDLFEFTIQVEKAYDDIYLEIDDERHYFRNMGENKYFLQKHYSDKGLGLHTGKIAGKVGDIEEILQESVNFEVLLFDINFHSWLAFDRKLYLLPNHPLKILIIRDGVRGIRLEVDGNLEYFKEEEENIYSFLHEGWGEPGLHHVKLAMLMENKNFEVEDFIVIVDRLFINGGLYPDLPSILKIPASQTHISFKIPIEGRIKKMRVALPNREESFAINDWDLQEHQCRRSGDRRIPRFLLFYG